MDFIPAGYLSIRDAVDRILRTTHGDDWGEQEVKFETDAIDGSMVLDDHSLSKGQPLDRQAVAKVRQQVSDAEVSLLSAFLTGDLGANIENGPPVPQSYWKSPSARTTVSTGILALGGGAKPEDLKWQNHRIILIGDKFDAWLAGPPSHAAKMKPRQHNIEEDLIIRNKIETVLAVAKRLWPSTNQVPGRNQMARLLAADDAVRHTGYKEPTIRKILNGSYAASRRLNIPEYPETNIRKK